MPEDEQKEMSNEQNPQLTDGSSGKDDAGNENTKLKSSWELAMENKHPEKSDYQNPVLLQEKKKEKLKEPSEKKEPTKQPTAEEIGKAVADALDKRGRGPEGRKEIKWDKAVEFLLAAGAVVDEVQEFVEYTNKHGAHPTIGGWVRWKRGKEKEQKISPTIQPEVEKLPSKEKTIEDLPFDELVQRTIQEEDEEKIISYKKEIHKRADEAESKQYFDRQYLKNKILDTTRESSWDTYYDNLITLAQNVENEARGHLGYRDNPRYDGLVEMAVKLAARKTKDEGISRKIDQLRNEGKPQEEIDNYLIRKFGSPKGEERYENNKKVLDRVQIIDFTALNLAEMVGADERRKREAAEEDKRRREEQMPKEEPEQENINLTAKEVAKGMKELRLSEEQELEDFIVRERWNDNVYEFDKKENLYYKSIEKTRDRQIFEWRVWLHWAMATRQSPDKNTGSWGAETFAGNSAMKRIPQEALQALISQDNFPGVFKVLHEYQKIVEEDIVPPKNTTSTGFEPPKGYYRDDKGEIQEKSLTLMDCVLRDDIDVYRMMVEQKVCDNLFIEYQQKGMDRDEAVRKARYDARNAEQIGWNIWVVQGGFDRESIWMGTDVNTGERRELTDDSDSRVYKDIVRIRGPKISQAATDMMHKPVRTFLNPIDALIDMATRKGAEDKEQKVGGLYDWAARNIRRSLTESGVDDLDKFSNDGGFEKVIIIDDNDEKNYWKVVNDNGKYTLYLPQFIPVRTMGSYFEHTKALDPKQNYKERSLIDFVREGREIPWEYTKGGFSSYLVDTSYWVNIWDTLSYETSKKGGEDEEVVMDMLGSVGRREDESFLRWIRYSHQGVDNNARLPNMAITPADRRSYELLRKQYKSEGVKDEENMYTKEKIYFRSDRKIPFRQRFRRWLRRTFW